jgi:glutamine synthetase
MALGAVVWAGLDGIRQKRGLPAPPARNFWDMSEAEREAAGVKPLPRSLSDALDHLEASPAARGWFGDTFFSAYLQFKRAELRALKGLVPAQICERYAAVY